MLPSFLERCSRNLGNDDEPSVTRNPASECNRARFPPQQVHAFTSTPWEHEDAYTNPPGTFLYSCVTVATIRASLSPAQKHRVTSRLLCYGRSSVWYQASERSTVTSVLTWRQKLLDLFLSGSKSHKETSQPERCTESSMESNSR